MQSVPHRRSWQFFVSWGANILPSPELGTPSSSKSKSHSASGQFMTVEEFLEKLKFLGSLCYMKRCLLWLVAQPWPLLSDCVFPPSSAKHFWMRSQIQIRIFGDGQGVFCTHILLGTKGIASLPCSW